MFNFFKKKKILDDSNKTKDFDIELTAAILVYEIARSDGEVTSDELVILMEEIEKIAEKVGKSKAEILKIIETYSNNSVSFHDLIEDNIDLCGKKM